MTDLPNGHDGRNAHDGHEGRHGRGGQDGRDGQRGRGGQDDLAHTGGEPRPQADRDVFALNPVISPERWEALVARINQRAEHMLAARRHQSLAGTLAGWQRPVLGGVAGLAAAAIAILLLLPAEEATPVETMFAEAMMPWSVAAWVGGSYAPTVEELVMAVEEGYTP